MRVYFFFQSLALPILDLQNSPLPFLSNSQTKRKEKNITKFFFLSLQPTVTTTNCTNPHNFIINSNTYTHTTPTIRHRRHRRTCPELASLRCCAGAASYLRRGSHMRSRFDLFPFAAAFMFFFTETAAFMFDFFFEQMRFCLISNNN